MYNRLLPIMTMLALMAIDALAVGKIIAYKPIYHPRIDGRVQYLRKGQAMLDLDRAPYVAIVDPSDSSIILTYPYFGNPDSLFKHFIPGNLISIRLSANVKWIDSTASYNYRYTIYSEKSSVRPIWEFEIEWSNDYKGVFSPHGWLVESLYRPCGRMYAWNAFQENDYLQPSDSLSGMGFRSFAPPVMAQFSVWGYPKEIAEVCPLDDYAASEGLGRAYAEVESQTRAAEGYTIAPGVEPEVIEPVEWFSRIDARTNGLAYWGYLTQETKVQVHQIFLPLISMFRKSQSHTLDKLNQEINAALAALAPYQDQMEPEAWAFITENLKYVVRHLDIVTFKEYP
jgi:hypothetical protein